MRGVTTEDRAISENTQDPTWDDRPDGSRVRRSNGIRIVDHTRTRGRHDEQNGGIEHLVTWQEDGGAVVVLGVDAACRPVYLTTFYSYL